VFPLSRRYPNNSIAVAMMNYVKAVDATFGLMSDPHANIESTETEAENG
jgi:hypothetical protein